MTANEINQRLHKEFVEKVEDFYNQKFKSHPDFSRDFSVDKVKDSFGRELKKEIEKETDLSNPLNHRTILNILNSGLASNARISTLDTLSKFLKYDSFEHYVKSLQNNKTKNKRRWPLMVVSFLFVCAGFYYLIQKNVDKEVLRIVTEANKAQFEAFRALPNVNTGELKMLYTSEGTAFKIVENVLKRSSMQNRVISLPEDNPSYYNLIDIKIIDRKSGRIVVETKEHWYLRWFSLDTQDYIKKYDVTNNQTYVLIKENGSWKIDSNDYMGTAQNIEPNLDKKPQ